MPTGPARAGRGSGAVPALFVCALLPLFGAAALASPAPQAVEEDWAESPEALFLTREERAAWKALDSRDSRDAFKERYWLLRDPSPGTGRNEFRETVLARIKVADERFPIEKTPGSRTARGRAFVLFGSPSRVRDEHAAPLRDARADSSPGNRGPVGIVEGNETTSTWTYDRERTPQVVDAVGQPSFEVRFVLEPNRRSDRLQNPGFFNDFKDTLAKKSIVNPDLVVARDAGPARMPSSAAPRDVISPAARAVLDAAPGGARGAGGSVFGSAILWRETGEAETLLWFFLPPATGKKMLVGTLRPEGGGAELMSISERAASSADFSTARPGEIVLRSLRLPPGNYDASFAVLDEASGSPFASVATTLRVPKLDGPFAVSSLILTRGPAPAEAGGRSPFAIGPSRIPPRADAAFAPAESLWYFLEIAGASDPAAVTLEPRIRRGADTIGGLAPFAAGLREIAPGRHLCGFELPLAGFVPGDYVLYVTARAGAGADQTAVRRAEFRVLER